MSYTGGVLVGDDQQPLHGEAFKKAMKSRKSRIILLNTEEDKWKYLPTFGQYHLLPGNYILGVVAEGIKQGNPDKKPTKVLDYCEVGFANGEPFRDIEFVRLDGPPQLLQEVEAGADSRKPKGKKRK